MTHIDREANLFPELTSSINVPLLRKTLEHITEHPEEWDQGTWARQKRDDNGTCGTVCCLAGTAVVLAGHEIDWAHPSNGRNDSGEIVAQMTTAGAIIEDVAREELGLSWAQADYMFSACNRLRDLWVSASDMTDGEIAVPEGEMPDGNREQCDCFDFDG